MNIKSLLLGSAAALAAVSGAQAADAIVAAEPEPMEYVRVCDAFGTGYFYIPGTETCLKIGGYVRVDIEGGDPGGQDTYGFNADGERVAFGGGDSWRTRTRVALRLSTATDTEYGALKTYTEVRFDRDDNSDSDSYLQEGYIELAGFLVGYTDSAFSSFTGFANENINDYWDVDYGDFQTTQLTYKYDTGAGFSAVISLEDGSDSDDLNYDSYVPNVVAGLGFNGGVWQLRAVGAYDDFAEEGAVKVRGDVTFGPVSLFAMGGWNTDGDFQNKYARWDGDWAVWLGGSYTLTEKATINGSVNFDDGDNVEAALNVAYQVVPGFSVIPEVNYRSDMDEKAGPEAEDWGGIIRFQRNF